MEVMVTELGMRKGKDSEVLCCNEHDSREYTL